MKIITQKSSFSRFSMSLLFCFLSLTVCLGQGQGTTSSAQERAVSGTVVDDNGSPMIGVTVYVKSLQAGTTTNSRGEYRLAGIDANSQLEFSFIGYETIVERVGTRNVIDIAMKEINLEMTDIVVVGYGTRKKEAVTGAIASIGQAELSNTHGATTSSLLSGKLPGISFRQSDGRPGAGANLQIRNYGGDPLFVIDGVAQDRGAFDQLGPDDIESISVLKDAAAAIYGLRAGNGVVLVTTKTGRENTPAKVNVNMNHGWQNWTRFPTGVNAYEWQLAKAEGQVNGMGNGTFRGTPDVNAEELEKWRAGTEPGYQSFDWYDFIVNKNAPQSQINVNVSGGGATNKYYVSYSRFDQDAAFTDYNYKRTNIQSNLESSIGKRIKVGMNLSGRVDSKRNPAVAGADTDDYWQPRNALLNLLPFERPYANDNEKYVNRTQVPEANWAGIGYDNSGYYRYDLRVVTANMYAQYDVPFIKGLSAKYTYSYQLADNTIDNFEYAYQAYTYNDADQSYTPYWVNSENKRERTYKKVFNHMSQFMINYDRTFGDKHHVTAVLANERTKYHPMQTDVAATPNNTVLPIIMYNDLSKFNDTDSPQARIGYIMRGTYDYMDKYYFEFSGRYDASWKFHPDERWSFFPSVSGGWRISQEPFFKENISRKVFSDMKLRVSYGIVGDDSFGDVRAWYGAADYRLGDYAYISSYANNSSSTVLDGEVVVGIRDNGMPVTNVSWLKSRIFNVGLDFASLEGKLWGSFDFFRRERKGLLWPRNDLLLPSELGYSMAYENLNKDATFGGEFSVNYRDKIGELTYTIGANISYARSKTLYVYNERMQYANSLEYYKGAQTGRYHWVNWGYETEGVFRNQDQINDWPVNIDGKGNVTLLPGDFIIKDNNGDGRIDSYDQVPISYMDNEARAPMPIINGGLTMGLDWKGIDFVANFSFASGYAFTPNWETKWPFQNSRTLVKATQFDDRWRRADPYDINSEWIAGDVPPLRFNARDYSSWNLKHDYWTTNVRAFRLRSLEIGYTLPTSWTQYVGIEKLRVYFNAYNLFSIDNVKKYGVDPEIADRNGMQYPQNRVISMGLNLSF